MNEVIWFLSPEGSILLSINFYCFTYWDYAFSVHDLINEHNPKAFRVYLRIVNSSIIYMVLEMIILASMTEKKICCYTRNLSHNITSSTFSQIYGVRPTHHCWIYRLNVFFSATMPCAFPLLLTYALVLIVILNL